LKALRDQAAVAEILSRVITASGTSDGCSALLQVLNSYFAICIVNIIARSFQNGAGDDKFEPHAIVEAHRPFDGGGEDLPWQEGLGGRKTQFLAGDVHTLAGKRPASR
jgi:hypothetical protein